MATARPPRGRARGPQVNAAAAVCNLVLEFSAVKASVLAHGALEGLTALAAAPSPPLRLHSCWALRNLAYKSDAGVRQALMQVRTCCVCVLRARVCVRGLACTGNARVRQALMQVQAGQNRAGDAGQGASKACGRR